MGPASLQIELKSVRVCNHFEIFFSEPILGPPNVDFSRENAKMNVKKVILREHLHLNDSFAD